MSSGVTPTSRTPLAPGARGGAGSILRIVLIALPLIVLNAFWVIEAERVGRGPYFTCISLFANVFFILTALVGINALLRRFAPRLALSQAELLIIYTMLTVAAGIAGQDFLPALVMMLGHVTWFANGSNGWADRFGLLLPQNLVVSSKEALRGYYEGNSTLYTPEHLQAWAGPVGWWTLFVVVLLWCMMCLNVLMRQGWQDRERLAFPVVEIPLQMTDPGAALWRSRLFWGGFALCATIELINGLAYLYPNVPSIPIKAVNVQGQGIFATHPWNSVGYTCYSFYPFVIGLGYLLPLDLSFSCWFFYLFWKLQMVVSAAMAWNVTPDFPFVREQSFGGYMAILVFVFWNGRSYFRQVWKRILGDPADLTDRNEAMTYRQSAFGFAVGFAFLVWFMIRAGLSPLVAVAAFIVYFAISLAITRMRAELGPPVHDLHFSGPDYLLTHSLGTPAFGDKDLTVLTFFYWFNRAYRSHPMPFGIEGLKAVATQRSAQSALLWCVMLAAIAGTLSAFWAYLHLAYRLGSQVGFAGRSYFADEAFNRLNGWIQTPQPPNHLALGAIGVGFVFCALLMIARTTIPWWPFHAFGYAISSSWAMNNVWLPLLLAWAAKGLILRYGGVRLYRGLMPFFLGMVLGQMVVGSLWHLLGLAMDIQPYSFWTG
ncbi:MAG: DUF6785 family protein [Armatimonadota bacterium]